MRGFISYPRYDVNHTRDQHGLANQVAGLRMEREMRGRAASFSRLLASLSTVTHLDQGHLHQHHLLGPKVKARIAATRIHPFTTIPSPSLVSPRTHLDQGLLHQRHLLGLNIKAKVAAADDDAVRLAQDRLGRAAAASKQCSFQSTTPCSCFVQVRKLSIPGSPFSTTVRTPSGSRYQNLKTNACAPHLNHPYRDTHIGDPRHTLQRATRAAHVRGVHSQGRGGQIGRRPSHMF